MTKNIEDVRRFWDSLPLGVGFIPGEVGSKEWFNEFDRIKSNIGMLGVLRHFAPETLRRKSVLDVGCGPGFWARLFAPMESDYTGIDISINSVQLARRSLELNGFHGKVLNGNAETLPFADGTFDAVVSEGVIHHTPDTQGCVDEIYRVLKPGGRAAVSVYYNLSILRSPAVFGATRLAMKALGAIQGGRGREKMVEARSALDFVRMYDGVDNPIGKAYTKPELRRAFGRFKDLHFYRYFMPPIPQFMNLPRPLQMVLSRFGLMMLVVARKP